MPKNIFKKLALLLVLFSTYMYAQVSGIVFRDFNSNSYYALAVVKHIIVANIAITKTVLMPTLFSLSEIVLFRSLRHESHS
ncbi:MAG: hypothetical protein JNM36_14945 [Chitinophagales bacterium]|nr:hypothetical protein [Chitinophagales bacterium]